MSSLRGQQPWNTAWGEVAYADNVNNATSASTTDVVICSATFTAVANRKYIVTCGTRYVISTVATDTIKLSIKEGATVLRATYSIRGGSAEWTIKRLTGVSAGAHTYDYTVSRAAGTGTVTAYGEAADDSEQFIMVEDIGPA